ncbi:hypothetical protein [Jeotgalibacillus proteolyticus]|uniref:Siderophore-iron reductase FhuF n=1 Tax=Jeotgalibacillus proteolyticus TaxID=2082395 RepID=A0A2S5GCI6_9BACL|nr:hypothetical protein [Jeotgalibacillus proteolyticus]PPA70613.1 hypothetical protein C4B60_07370 [Jeotgalibacillus proteolyticus]
MRHDELLPYISNHLPVFFGPAAGSLVWDVTAWKKPSSALQDLTLIQQLQGAPKLNVTGSLAVKRLSFIYLGALLAYYRSGEHWDLAASSVQIAHDKESVFQLKLYTAEVSLSRTSPQNWMEPVKDNFINWLKPLVEAVERVTKVNQIILWENVFIYLKWFYEVLAPSLSELEENEWKNQWEEIVSESFFGEDTPNPFAYLNKTKAKRTMEDGKRVRHTCCYKYRLPGGKNCKTCCQIKA